MPENIIEVLPNPPPSAQKYLKDKKKLHLPSCSKHRDETSTSLQEDKEWLSTHLQSESTKLTENSGLIDLNGITKLQSSQLQEDECNKISSKEERVYTFNNCQFTYVRPESEEVIIPELSPKDNISNMQKDQSDSKSKKEEEKLMDLKEMQKSSLASLLETIELLNQQKCTTADKNRSKMSVSELSFNNQSKNDERTVSFHQDSTSSISTRPKGPSRTSSRHNTTPVPANISQRTPNTIINDGHRNMLTTVTKELSDLSRGLKHKSDHLKEREINIMRKENILKMKEKEIQKDVEMAVNCALLERDSVY